MNPVRPKPNPALKRLAKLIGVWEIKGRTLDSNDDNIEGKVTIDWFSGGFFMMLRGEMGSKQFKVHSLEIIGYNPKTKIFPAYVYSDMAGVPSKYYWDVRGDIVRHWTKGARYAGRLSIDGNTLSGGWRPIGRERRTPGNTYDAIMTRVE